MSPRRRERKSGHAYILCMNRRLGGAREGGRLVARRGGRGARRDGTAPGRGGGGCVVLRVERTHLEGMRVSDVDVESM